MNYGLVTFAKLKTACARAGEGPFSRVCSSPAVRRKRKKGEKKREKEHVS